MLDLFLLHGTPTPPTEPLALRAGPLTLLFEPETGMIRRICYGDTEIWRGLYIAVRDQNWGTIAPRLFNLKTDIKDDSFEISFDVECKNDTIDFVWHGLLRGGVVATMPAVILYRMTGEARSTFLRNRIGFCLLHPPKCAGQPCVALNSEDSNSIHSHFPDTISPHQPFKNLIGFNHEFAPDQWAQAGFHGDAFEMEDQRNWTDASFKTYCTPLDLPFPVEVKAGTIIEQTVTLRLLESGLKSPVYPPGEKPTNITSEESGNFPKKLPSIGLCMASHGEPLTENETNRLRLLHMSHLRADLRFRGDWQAKLKQAAQEARALNTKIELALHLPPEPQQILREVVAALEENEVPIARFLIFSDSEKVTTENTARSAREVLALFGAPLVGGTDFYFTEINRQHPPLDLLDGVCFSITPQVHAFDNLSLMENLEMQATVVQNARRLFNDLPIHISPVTFKKRPNPDAASAESQTLSDELPPDVDARQVSLFGAAWTMGSLKTLSEAGAKSITYYETTGLKGVMQQENAAPHPLFPAPAGESYPLFWVIGSAVCLQNFQ